MTRPKTLMHLESPLERPLLQPFFVAGWVASMERIHSVRGAHGEEWLTLADRPDVRAAHPSYPHSAGFHGELSFQALDENGVRLVVRAGDHDVPFAAALAPMALPPDHLQERQVGGIWGSAFHASGRVMFDQIAGAFAEAGRPLGSAARILDFGCGCGRVIWMFKHLPHAGEVWGCDIDAEAMAWDAVHLGSVAQFQCTPSRPPTAFPDGFFDAIYSVSVFTHLPEDLQFAWLAELRRLLRPGGVLIASLHGAHYWDRDPGVRAEVSARGFAYRTGERTPGLPEFYMVAYHSPGYIRTQWSRYFDVVAVKERFIYDAHDAAVLRRRDD